MISLDFRTRSDDEVLAVDIVDFMERQLRELAAYRSELAVPGALELGARPFTIETPAGAWTLSIDDVVRIERGSRGEGLVRLDADDLTDLIYDLRTPMTFFTAGCLEMPRGRLRDFLDWWVILRSLLDGRPVHTAGSVDFCYPDGDPLDLHSSFSSGDDETEMAQFLAEAGYLHVAGVFTEEEMAQVSADMDDALPHYGPDDGRSWWARTADGERRPVRLQWFQEHSPTTAALLSDDRFLRIGRLTSDGHVSSQSTGNVIEALVKPIGVVEGISDLPWHKDCSLGRHSYQCCGLTVGISVTGANARSGQLAVVAGSHRALVQPAFVRSCWGLPEIDLPTSSGDVTVHCSCTLHMSHPPVDHERRVMYTSFSLPPRSELSARGSIDSLARVREQAYRTVSQAPGYVPVSGPET